MIAPEGATSISIEGREIEVVDGKVHADERDVETLISLGFVSASAGPDVSDRAKLVAHVHGLLRTQTESMSDDRLKEFMGSEQLQQDVYDILSGAKIAAVPPEEPKEVKPPAPATTGAQTTAPAASKTAAKTGDK